MTVSTAIKTAGASIASIARKPIKAYERRQNWKTIERELNLRIEASQRANAEILHLLINGEIEADDDLSELIAYETRRQLILAR